MGEGGPMSKIVETGLKESKPTETDSTNFRKIVSKSFSQIQKIVTNQTSQVRDEACDRSKIKEMEPLRLKTVQSKYLDLVFTYNVNEDVPEREGEPGHNMDQPKLSFRKRIPLKKKYNSIWDNSTPTCESADPSELVNPSESIDFSESALNCSTLTCEPADSSEPALGYLNISTFRPVDPPESVDPIPITAPLTTNRVLISYPTTKLHEDSKT